MAAAVPLMGNTRANDRLRVLLYPTGDRRDRGFGSGLPNCAGTVTLPTATTAAAAADNDGDDNDDGDDMAHTVGAPVLSSHVSMRPRVCHADHHALTDAFTALSFTSAQASRESEEELMKVCERERWHSCSERPREV